MLKNDFKKYVEVLSTISNKSLKDIKIQVLKNYLKYFYEEESNPLNNILLNLKNVIK